jgi:hypothetical protein
VGIGIVVFVVSLYFLACLVVLAIGLRMRIIFWPFGSKMTSLSVVLSLMLGEWLSLSTIESTSGRFVL